MLQQGSAAIGGQVSPIPSVDFTSANMPVCLGGPDEPCQDLPRQWPLEIARTDYARAFIPGGAGG